MDGIHDMGGMAGFGRVDVHDAEPTHEPWEARAQVVALLSNDGVRASIEALAPDEYLTAGYFGRWVLSAERRSLETGKVSRGALERWRTAFSDDPDLSPPRSGPDDSVEGLVGYLTTTSPMGPATSARLGVGDQVRVRRMRPEGHHRCPRYVRGVLGVVERVAGEEHVPAPAPGEAPGPLETVYTVRFDSTDLWGDQADAGQPPFELMIDLWDRYLEPA